MRHRFFNSAAEIEEVINKCDVCYIGMSDKDGMPYVLPFNFAFEGNTIFLHSAREGKKIDILKERPDVCIAFSADHHLRYQNEEVACSWSMKYRSVLAYGKVSFINDFAKKTEVMNTIMRKYAGRDFKYNAPAIKDVQAFCISVDTFEGKAYGY